MMHWEHGFSWEWVLYGGIMMLLFWGGLIASVTLAFRTFSGFRRSVSPSALKPNPALDILNERYARGEINRDEYMNMRQDLDT